MRRVMVVAAIVLVATSAVGGVAIASEHGNADADETEFTIDELEERGMQIEDADPSRRYLGDKGSVYVSYAETNFVKKLGDQSPEWSVDKVVSSDKTIDTEEVTMHFSRSRDAPSETLHVHVVAWERETRTVQEGNTTREEPYAANVSETVHEVELSGGADKATIPLPDTENEQRLTIWIEEYPDARWGALTHEPVALTDSLPFGPSWSSFLPWFITRFFGLVAVGVPVAIGSGVKTIDKYGAGPGKGAIWWLFVLGLGSYFVGYFKLDMLAELLVAAPWVMGVLVVAIAYVATVEYVGDADQYLFEQVLTKSVTNPIGEDVPDVVTEKGQEVDVVDLEGTDEVGLVKSGSLKSFLAIVAGAKMPRIDEGTLDSRVRYDGPFDGKFYVDEPSEDDDVQEGDLLKIEWPTISFSFSNLKEAKAEVPEGADIEDGNDETGLAKRTESWGNSLGTAAMTFGIGTAIGTSILGAVNTGMLVGFAPVALMMGTVEHGSVDWVEAPAHSTSAKAQRVTEENEYEIAKTFDKVTEKLADDDVEAVDKALQMTENYIDQQRRRVDRIFLGEAAGEDRFDELDEETNGEATMGVGDD